MSLFRTNTFSLVLFKNLKTEIYRTIILPVVLYGCEVWALTLREECRLRVFDNMIIRSIFGSKKNGYRDWRRLHYQELHSLCRLRNMTRKIKSRRLRWTKIFIGKPTRKSFKKA